MPQKDVIRTLGTRWDFLEPAMNPNMARTKHGKLKAASAATYVHYPKGQVIGQKNDGTNEWAKYGTSGYGAAGVYMILKQPILVDDAGRWQLTDSAVPLVGDIWCEGSVDAYYTGYFRCEDIVSAGGTNEVQTLTLDVDVDGGTFKISWGGYGWSAPIAWNATAAQIEAALDLVTPSLAAGDITSSGGAGGPHTFTFTGAYAGANVPLLQLDITGLTDGGGPVVADATAVVETTPGAGLLTGVGRLVQGTSSVGIFELGAAPTV